MPFDWNFFSWKENYYFEQFILIEDNLTYFIHRRDLDPDPQLEKSADPQPWRAGDQDDG
jgi:hypothetical protein